MSDLECPYCKKDLEVCHDDGQGYEEGVKHQMTCDYCGKSFVFETSIIFYYEPEKADCLNGKNHKWKQVHTHPKEHTTMECEMCGEIKKPTKSEMEAILL